MRRNDIQPKQAENPSRRSRRESKEKTLGSLFFAVGGRPMGERAAPVPDRRGKSMGQNRKNLSNHIVFFSRMGYDKINIVPVSAQAADGAGAGFVPRTNPADSAGTRHSRNGELE